MKLLQKYVLDSLLRERSLQSYFAMFFALIGLTVVAVAIVPANVYAAAPTAHWTLDETSGTRVDSIGGRNLTPTGSVGSAAGQVDGAATITASSQYLSTADHSSLSSGGETSFSISMWVKLNSKTGTQVFASKYAGASGEYAVFYEHSFRRFMFSTYSGGQNQFAQANAFGEPATDTWYHIVAVHDAAANTNTIYVNGQSNTAGSISEPSDTNAPFTIGAFGPGFLYPALATIDDVQFYRVALSGGDVTEINDDAQNALIAHWKFDEGSGTTAIDSSGNGYNGTITGATYTATIPDVQFNNPHSIFFNPATSGRIVSTNLQLNNYTQFTMAGWAYPTAADSRASWFGQNDLFEFGFTDSNTLFCYTSKGEVSWDFNPGTFLNNWHHITCLATSTDLILYIDGVNVGSTAIGSGSFGSSGHNFSIGAGAVDGGTSGPFSGYIDDVRVYNRGLTPEEMEALGTGETGPGVEDVPSVAITAPADASAVNAWNPVIDWSDADTCEYSWNNTDWTIADCSESGGDIPEPSEGENINLYIRGQYDGSSDHGSVEATFTLDSVAPTVNAGDNRHINTAFTQSSATASDGLSGIATYSWSKQSGPGTVTFANSAVLNPTVSAISLDGTYTLRLTVTDNAGNSAHDDVTVLWDTTSPDIELEDFPDLITNQTSASFAFAASDNLSAPVTFSCKLDGFSFNSCVSPKEYSELSEGEHTVTIRATDSIGNMHTSDPYTWTVDTTAPVITLAGITPITIVAGESYSDAGATASDNESGDITEAISTNNPVNTSTPGTYEITYNVTDEASNSAETITRIVTVVPNEDFNNDGTVDGLQDNVSAYDSPITNKTVVIDVGEDCELTTDDLMRQADIDFDDPGYTYDNGLFDFAADCGTPGFSTTVNLYYYNVNKDGLVARKYNPNTQEYSTIPGATISETTIDGAPVTILSYQIVDGGPLDTDNEVNGQFTDPAGLALAENTNTSERLADTGYSQLSLIVVAIVLSTLGLAIVVKPASIYGHHHEKLRN